MPLTREFFDGLIIVVILVGLVLAARRLHQDLTRPLPPAKPRWAEDDTDPHLPSSK
jgi:hypothetical protein